MSRIRSAIVLGACLLLQACAGFSPDGGMDVVAGIAERALDKDVAALRTPDDVEEAQARVKHLLRRPLTADAAVQIALLNNRGLQAAYNELGIAESAMVAASTPQGPGLSLQRLSGPIEIEIERRIVADILSLAMLPARADIAADRFRQAQLRAAEETLRLAAETRRAHYRAVAARELADFLVQSQSAAETAAQIARRLGESGAMNRLDQAREQVFSAEITAQLASARQRASSERERLVRLLGLWGKFDLKLPAALPLLPRTAKALPKIEVEAVKRRVDLQIARIELVALAKSYGLTQASRFINLMDVSGVSRTTIDRQTGEKSRINGFDIELQIPIFDFGEARLREAQATYMQALNRLAGRAVNVRSQARDAYRNYRSTYDIARHYQREVLPLRQIISEETQLRYGAMQIDVFALLTDARARIVSTTAAVEAKRDFWLASADLQVAISGGGMAGEAGRDTMRPMAAEAGTGSH